MRVTESLRFDLINRRLSTLRARYQETALEAATGQRIHAPSDDPVAAAEAARIHARQSQVQGNQRSIELVRGDVEMAESALAQAGDLFQRAREIAITGANGIYTAEQRQALAQEANQLIEQAIELANARGSQGYLFAGTRSDTAAFDANGVFQGNDGQHLVDSGTGGPINVSASGARAFTAAGGRDVIEDLRTLARSLETNDPESVRNVLEDLQSSQDQIARERSQTGLILNRLEASESLLSQLELDLTRRESGVVAADPVETLTRLAQLESAITGAVEVGRRMLDLGNLQRF